MTKQWVYRICCRCGAEKKIGYFSLDNKRGEYRDYCKACSTPRNKK